MQQTRRTFFAAIGAAVLGKYAVKFWPQVAPPVNRQAFLDYVTTCHEQAAHTFAAYVDACFLSGSPRQNAIITNIGVPKRRMSVRFDPARLPA